MDKEDRVMSYGREQWIGRWETLCEQFEMGEIGDVEFTEMALSMGMDLNEIGEILERVREDAE